VEDILPIARVLVRTSQFVSAISGEEQSRLSRRTSVGGIEESQTIKLLMPMPVVAAQT